jgi:hypothetical protein
MAVTPGYAQVQSGPPLPYHVVPDWAKLPRRSCSPAIINASFAARLPPAGDLALISQSGAIAAGLVDDYHVFLVAAVVGGGTRFLPDGVRLDLELIDEHRFRSGVVHLHYRTKE